MDATRLRGQRRARWLERSLFAVGAITLIACALVLWWRDAQSDALIERFAVAQAIADGKAASVAEAAPAVPASDLSVLPPDQSDWSDYRRERYRPSDALPLAVLRIERIDLEVPVLAGTATAQLEQGVGWLARTAALGRRGNAALAGHRDSFFRRLGELRNGDRIRIDTLDGVLEYRVRGHRIVKPDDVSVLRPQGNGATLTLITCYPFRFVGRAPQRYILFADQISPAPGGV